MANHQQENNVQDFPSPDSLPTEPFESIVELYYQTQGYITSSNKWFRVFGQRGSSDIDVLALNGNETLIISITVNLNDKVENEQIRQTLLTHFKRVMDYLCAVEEYAWLVRNPREVRRILAYEVGYGKPATYQQNTRELAKEGIDFVSANDVMRGLIDYVRNTQNEFPGQNLKTNNPLVMMVRLLLPWLKKA